MSKDKLEKNHNCDNINCNHNNTEGLCCMFNPDVCKYRQLQKEYVALKNDVELWKKASENNSFKAFQLEKENKELKNRNQELLESCEGATMMYKDLQKANEIIKKYLSIGVGGKITQNYLDITKEAEQFLKDCKVEK